MLNNVTADKMYLTDDDPVRPELSYTFRISNNKEFLVLEDKVPAACICVAYLKQVPTEVKDLVVYDDDEPSVAVFYTVWSYTKGAGRDIVFRAVEYIKETRPEINRFVTLSPKTEMARKFHLKNGAILLNENAMTDNYEYLV